MTSIDSINGMTHIEATKLRRARVRTTVTFLQIASTRSGRALLTKETGKSSYEHVASTITGKDCKFTRILKDKKICMSEKEYKDYLLSLNCDTYKWDILGNVSCEKKGK